mmetsp:Transcript_22678/g.61420  ORF Transcript_22678/g.61420 Transcript_22678/m.61420 type:complete len:203 (-) Transcript_22678:329-937(-)
MGASRQVTRSRGDFSSWSTSATASSAPRPRPRRSGSSTASPMWSPSPTSATSSSAPTATGSCTRAIRSHLPRLGSHILPHMERRRTARTSAPTLSTVPSTTSAWAARRPPSPRRAPAPPRPPRHAVPRRTAAVQRRLRTRGSACSRCSASDTQLPCPHPRAPRAPMARPWCPNSASSPRSSLSPRTRSSPHGALSPKSRPWK